MPAPAAFAIPGDIATKTGGYIYERRLLEGLRAEGRTVTHIELPASFPDPSPADTAATLERLGRIPPGCPLILDGLVFGAIDPNGLAQLDCPVVAMVHHPLGLETGLAPARAADLLRIEAANLRIAAHVVVPSPHTARVLVQDFAVAEAKISVAPPGVDRASRPQAPSAPPLILSVGIQHPRKGHDVLLRALGAIADRDWRAVIVGAPRDPAHAATLEAMRTELGLEPRVRLAGQVAQTKLEALYRAASLFALATRYEGYGMVFAEALVRGLPIVTCASGAVPETVPAEAGLLVPPDDPEAFAAALAALIDDPGKRARHAAAAARAGAALPRWADTAAVMSGVLDRFAHPQ